MPEQPPSDRTRVRRHPERGVYDRETIYAILDEALICHLAYAVDGHPTVIPTVHARVGDTLYLHGSQASRTVRALRTGVEVCVEATLLDGLLLARSTPKHSMNYRSAVVYGVAREVVDPVEVAEAQKAIMEHVIPGRMTEVRQPNEKELEETAFLAVPLSEASAKVRTGPPKDPEEDLTIPVWAGVLPLHLVAGEPEPDPKLSPGTPVPDYVRRYGRSPTA